MSRDGGDRELSEEEKGGSKAEELERLREEVAALKAQVAAQAREDARERSELFTNETRLRSGKEGEEVKARSNIVILSEYDLGRTREYEGIKGLLSKCVIQELMQGKVLRRLSEEFEEETERMKIEYQRENGLKQIEVEAERARWEAERSKMQLQIETERTRGATGMTQAQTRAECVRLATEKEEMIAQARAEFARLVAEKERAQTQLQGAQQEIERLEQALETERAKYRRLEEKFARDVRIHVEPEVTPPSGRVWRLGSKMAQAACKGARVAVSHTPYGSRETLSPSSGHDEESGQGQQESGGASEATTQSSGGQAQNMSGGQTDYYFSPTRKDTGGSESAESQSSENQYQKFNTTSNKQEEDDDEGLLLISFEAPYSKDKEWDDEFSTDINGKLIEPNEEDYLEHCVIAEEENSVIERSGIVIEESDWITNPEATRELLEQLEDLGYLEEIRQQTEPHIIKYELGSRESQHSEERQFVEDIRKGNVTNYVPGDHNWDEWRPVEDSSSIPLLGALLLSGLVSSHLSEHKYISNDLMMI